MKHTRKQWLTARIGKVNDGRRRLTENQVQQIKELYATGKYGQRTLARMFNVSRGTVQFHAIPGRREQLLAGYHARGGWRNYYEKAMHRNAVRKYRQKIRKVYFRD